MAWTPKTPEGQKFLEDLAAPLPEKKAEEIPENIIEVPEEVSEAAEKVEEKLKI